MSMRKLDIDGQIWHWQPGQSVVKIVDPDKKAYFVHSHELDSTSDDAQCIQILPNEVVRHIRRHFLQMTVSYKDCDIILKKGMLPPKNLAYEDKRLDSIVDAIHYYSEQLHKLYQEIEDSI